MWDRPRHWRLVGIAVAALTALVLAPSPTAAQSRSSLVPVEQGVEDLGPLDVTFRAKAHYLQPLVPENFQGVYQSTDHPERYYRFDRGITVAFPASKYVEKDGQRVPAIPPGSVFYFGRPPELRDDGVGPMQVTAYGAAIGVRESEESADRRSASPHRIDNRVSLRISAAADQADQSQRLSPPRFEAFSPASGVSSEQGGVSPVSQPYTGGTPVPLAGLSSSRSYSGWRQPGSQGQPGLGENSQRSARSGARRRPTVWSSERYRRVRIANLLTDAAQPTKAE